MALAERLRSDTSAFLKNTRNWVNKKCALQRRTIQNELWFNDGDDGRANDDEDVMNKNGRIESLRE